jgi:hypothetical protein
MIASNMKTMKLKIIGLIILAGCSWQALAQQDTINVYARAKVSEKSIRLRWVVDSPSAWLLGNKYGYRVERYTVMRDSVWLPNAEKKIIAEALRPQPLDQWETLALADDYAAVIAQAIYGDSFEIDAGKSGNITAIVQRSQEQEQRYFIALYAADHSFQAACMAGLGCLDEDVRKGERYLYRIIPLLPAGRHVEIGAIYTGMDDYVELPKPQGLAGRFGDRTAMLLWEYRILQEEYGSYYLERSDDNEYFYRLSDKPLTGTEDAQGNPMTRIYYIDSLPQNNKNYYYRVIGMDAFGDIGPPSDTIMGKGLPVLQYTPQVIRAVTDEQGVMTVDWEFEKRGEPLLKSFSLQRSDNNKGPFVDVIENISPEQRRITYDKLQSTNYFRMAAIPHTGEPRAGFAVLVQPVDSIPPVAPSGLQGHIDTTGVVHLSWTPNTESDLYGYRIYRALDEREELVPLNDIAWRDTVFTDTVQMKQLNAKVYYAITALDHRYNQSKSSPVCILKKPDVIPPVAPLIKNYEAREEGVMIYWERSPDTDVAAHIIYSQKDGKEKTLITITDTLTHYLDTSTVAKEIYRYYMKAVDSSGLFSMASPVVAVRSIAKMKGDLAVERLTLKADRKAQTVTITWRHRLANVRSFLIYRAVDDEPLSLLESVSGNQLSFVDAALQANKKYRYAVRPLFENSSYGEMVSKNIQY